MRIFITGVTGFIGGQLARVLADDEHDVAGFARLTSRRDLDLPIRFYRGSLLDREAVRWAVRDFQPDAVLHLGAITPVGYSFDHPQEVIETNLLGTVNLAEACRKEAAVARFIFASSMEVYGQQAGRTTPFEETDETRPSCPYAVAKLAVEKYLAYLGEAYNFPWLALRQTNTYGRTTDDRFVVEALLTRMLRGGPITMGAKEPVRNFLFIDDLVALYRRLLVVPFRDLRGEVYNTGPANGITIEQLAHKCADAVGWLGRITWNCLPPRPGEVFYLNATGAAIMQRTGWSPKNLLDEGLRRTAARWRTRLSAASSWSISNVTQVSPTGYLCGH